MAIGRRVRSAAGRLRRAPALDLPVPDDEPDPSAPPGPAAEAPVPGPSPGPAAEAPLPDAPVPGPAEPAPGDPDGAAGLPPWAVPYEVAERPAVPQRPGIHSPAARTLLRDWFRAVFAAEAPIHESLLFARLRADWRIEAVGTRVLANIEPVLTKASVDGRPVTRDAAGFYRITGRRLSAVRIPAADAARRTTVQVPADELELAVTRAVADAPAPTDAVADRVCALLRWSTVDGAGPVTAAITHLLALDVLTRDPAGTLSAGTVVPPG